MSYPYSLGDKSFSRSSNRARHVKICQCLTGIEITSQSMDLMCCNTMYMYYCRVHTQSKDILLKVTLKDCTRNHQGTTNESSGVTASGLFRQVKTIPRIEFSKEIPEDIETNSVEFLIVVHNLISCQVKITGLLISLPGKVK